MELFKLDFTYCEIYKKKHLSIWGIFKDIETKFIPIIFLLLMNEIN